MAGTSDRLMAAKLVDKTAEMTVEHMVGLRVLLKAVQRAAR